MFRFISLAAIFVAGFAWGAEGSVSTVNGGINVSNGAPGPAADRHTVNESIDINSSQQVGNLSTVNGSIHVDDGRHTGDVTVVNGGIHVGSNAQIGHVSSVNGSITLGEHTAAPSISSVNGAIRVGAGSVIGESIHTVNGALELAQGSDLKGPLTNVNGSIRLVSAHVGGGIKTVNGDIDVGTDSRVEGGIHVEKPQENWFSWLFGSSRREPRIVIEHGAVVTGKLYFEQPVKLYVSDRATVGPIEGATAVRFSGDRAPE